MRGRSVAYGLCALLIIAVGVPFAARAATVQDLMAQIAALLAEVEVLQREVNAGASVSTPSYQSGVCVAGVLRIGSRGSGVTNLQAYLAKDPAIYPEGIVSGYFGSLTERAVERYQSTHGIVSSGTPDETGFGLVGPRTRAHVNARCVPQAGVAFSGGIAGGAREDSISLRSGGASALSVIADVVVNGSGSCQASTYALDWGDTNTTIISVPAGLCAPHMTSRSHTYTRAGDYFVTLHTPTGSKQSSLSVSQNTCMPPQFVETFIPGMAVNSAFQLPLLYEPAGEQFSVTGSGFPPGLSLRALYTYGSGATRRSWDLIGAPTATGSYHIRITAENTCGKTTRSYSVVVQEEGALEPRCPNVVPETCVGTLESLGRDASGCVTGYRCVANACPTYTTPTCLSDQHIVYGAPEWNGCRGAPRCVSKGATLFTFVHASTTNAVRGGTLPIVWKTQNAPSGAKVRIELYEVGATTVAHNNDFGVGTPTLGASGSFTWTIPSAGAACESGTGLRMCVDPGSYRLVGKLYSGDTCWGTCTVTSRPIHAIGESAIFKIE